MKGQSGRSLCNPPLSVPHKVNGANEGKARFINTGKEILEMLGERTTAVKSRLWLNAAEPLEGSRGREKVLRRQRQWQRGRWSILHPAGPRTVLTGLAASERKASTFGLPSAL